MPEPAEWEAAGEETSPPPKRGKPTLANRLWALLRPSTAQLSLGVGLAMVAFAAISQFGTSTSQNHYDSMRRDDLIALLDTLTDETERLTNEVTELERTRDALQSGADAQEIAAAEAQQRQDSINILSGAVGATGPGIRVTISAPAGAIDADLILDAVQELRDSGAEVIEINDSIRLVAQSWMQMNNGTLVIDGQQVDLPITIDAIGDPQTLAEGTRFRGGLVSQIQAENIGGSVAIEESHEIMITALRTTSEPEFARPV